MFRRKKFQIIPNQAIAGVRTETAIQELKTENLADIQDFKTENQPSKVECQDSNSFNNVDTNELITPISPCVTLEEPEIMIQNFNPVDVVETEELNTVHTYEITPMSPLITVEETVLESDDQSLHNIDVVNIDEPITTITSYITQTLRGRKRLVKTGEELDTKKFTLADLIDWRPKTENTLRKKWDEKRQEMLENMTNSSTIGEDEEPTCSSNTFKFNKNNTNEPAAPRVKLNEKGEMVIDEESLILIDIPENNHWETIDDNCMPKKLNSMSFRKTRRPTIWCALETDLFYATGTDFTLMHEFLPTRTRAEIKKKFNREEKLDPERITLSLRYPTLLDNTLYERVKKFRDKIDLAANEKLSKAAEKKERIEAKRAQKKAKKPTSENATDAVKEILKKAKNS